MASRDPHQTDASGLEPTEVPSHGGDALTRAHAMPQVPAKIRASDRFKAAESARPAAVKSSNARSSQRQKISSGSTRTSLPAAASNRANRSASSSHLNRGISTRLPASLLLGPDPRPAQRTKARLLMILMVVIVLMPVPLIIGLRLWTRPDELATRATLAIQNGEQALTLVRDALSSRRIAEARKNLIATRQTLDVPAPSEARLTERLLALRGQCNDMQTEMDKIERDLKAQAHFQALMPKFNRLAELNAQELDALEKKSRDFMTNPIDPGAQTDATAAGTFRSLIDDIRRRIDTITAARQRLDTANANDQEGKARVEIAELVRTEHFQAALDRLADYKQKYPLGKFDDQQKFIENSAKRSWDAAKVYIESRLVDAKTPGVSASYRQQVIPEARKRLKEVVERFGVSAYVDEAKNLLKQIPE